jgi:hypothetical protein
MIEPHNNPDDDLVLRLVICIVVLLAFLFLTAR